MKTRFELQVTNDFHRRRLDEFLFDHFRTLSKAYLRRVVKEGRCEVNGWEANTGVKLRERDFVEIEIDIEYMKGMVPENIPIEPVYEDRQIIVINKAPGILVHPTNYERNGTLLNGLMNYLNSNPDQAFIRPHPIHRLDRDTSGLILFGKNAQTSKKLSDHFKRKLFEKRYLALVEGIVKFDEGEIEAPIGRFEELKQWDVKAGAKQANSKYRVLRRLSNMTLLELEPITGRTNQLRIHCAHIGHPIIGDKRFSSLQRTRMCLHAWKLSFWHPTKNERLNLTSNYPEFAE